MPKTVRMMTMVLAFAGLPFAGLIGGAHADPAKGDVCAGNLSPDGVQVQLFHGALDNQGEIPNPSAAAMSHNGAHEGSAWVFTGTIPCRSSGQHGFAVRVLPHNADLANPFEPGLVVWG